VSKLRLTLGCWNYDRTSALLDGRIQPDGIELTYLNLPVEETFFRMLRHREFEVAELSLSSYVMSLFLPDRPFVAIPVFPSRAFRHSSIFIHAASGIREPRDLIGRAVGTPEYQLTACVWIRGILSDDYGVAVDAVTYHTGGEEEPGRPEKQALQLPARIRVERIRDDRTLSAMLAAGEIAALHSPRAPSTLADGNGPVRRLFADFMSVEREYFRRTRIFPIMHVVVIRRDVYESARWIAQSLFKAFSLAQQATYADLAETAALKVMLPWLPAHLADVRREMGRDYWPYGLDANRHVLETFLRYHFDQGLSPELVTPERLFAPETLESFRI
jgi:4,5-dihydroxyphthalate decarboxylase